MSEIDKQTSRIIVRNEDCKDIILNETYLGFVEAAYIADEDGKPIRAWRKLHDEDELYDHYILRMVTWDGYGYQNWYTTVFFYPKSKYLEVCNEIFGGLSFDMYFSGKYGYFDPSSGANGTYTKDGFLFKNVNFTKYGLIMYKTSSGGQAFMGIFGNHILCAGSNVCLLDIDEHTLEITNSKIIADDSEGIMYITDHSGVEYLRYVDWMPIKDKIFLFQRFPFSSYGYTYYLKSIDGEGNITVHNSYDGLQYTRAVYVNGKEAFVILYKYTAGNSFKVYKIIHINENYEISESNWTRDLYQYMDYSTSYIKYDGTRYLIYTNKCYIDENNKAQIDKNVVCIYSTNDFFNFELVAEKTGSFEMKHLYNADLPLLICFGDDTYNAHVKEAGTNYKYVIHYYDCFPNTNRISFPLYTNNQTLITSEITSFIYYSTLLYVDNALLNESDNNFYASVYDFGNDQLYGRPRKVHNLHDHLEGITGEV